MLLSDLLCQCAVIAFWPSVFTQMQLRGPVKQNPWGDLLKDSSFCHELSFRLSLESERILHEDENLGLLEKDSALM